MGKQGLDKQEVGHICSEEAVLVDWNDVRLRLHGVCMNRSRGALELNLFFKALERKILDFSDRAAQWETAIRVEFEALQGAVTGKEYDMGQALDRLRTLVEQLVRVCKYLEENCAGLKEALEKLISEGLVTKSELTQADLPLRQLLVLLEVSVRLSRPSECWKDRCSTSTSRSLATATPQGLLSLSPSCTKSRCVSSSSQFETSLNVCRLQWGGETSRSMQARQSTPLWQA